VDFFFIRLVGVVVQLCPLGTAATDWPIVPAPSDYDDGEFGGMKIGRGNRSTRRKPAPAPLCPPQIPLDQTRDRPCGLVTSSYTHYCDTLFCRIRHFIYPLENIINIHRIDTKDFSLVHDILHNLLSYWMIMLDSMLLW
jgi:hypothetical protein